MLGTGEQPARYLSMETSPLRVMDEEHSPQRGVRRLKTCEVRNTIRRLDNLYPLGPKSPVSTTRLADTSPSQPTPTFWRDSNNYSASTLTGTRCHGGTNS